MDGRHPDGEIRSKAHSLKIVAHKYNAFPESFPSMEEGYEGYLRSLYSKDSCRKFNG
jgi:hypothetical protein